MNKLKMIKAFAKLEGVDLSPDIDASGEYWLKESLKTYNPITNLALNCAARDKYEVDIDHYNSHVSIASDYTDKPPKACVFFDESSAIPAAVIECILKSEDLLK